MRALTSYGHSATSTHQSALVALGYLATSIFPASVGASAPPALRRRTSKSLLSRSSFSSREPSVCLTAQL